MNLLISFYVDGAASERFQSHLNRVPDFLWESNKGMMMSGTNGSQLWDTCFILQAVVESGLAEEDEFRESTMKGLAFVDACQIKQDPVDHEKYYRYLSKGAWPFSTRDQSYTVSDCTAEGLKTALYLQNKVRYLIFLINFPLHILTGSNENFSYAPTLIDDSRLYDSVNVLLHMQNDDGGFGSYEPRRGPLWMEHMNPSEVFANIMIEYSYTECSTAVVLGLLAFQKWHPDFRKYEIKYVSFILL